MKKELDELLCKKYPKIFRDRNEHMSNTCMCWGFDHDDGWFNILDVLCSSIQNRINWSIRNNKNAIKHNAMVTATRAGDLTLFNEYYGKIDGKWKDQYLQEIQSTPTEDEGKSWSRGLRPVEPIVSQVVAFQVKEKFGGLRFYIDGGDDEIWGMVRFAEALSYRTCEQCGAPGQTVGKGWIKTLCPTHYREGDAGTERQIKISLVPEDEESEDGNK